MLSLLAEGELTVDGRLLDASNASLVGTVRAGDAEVRCVYKPVAGERPLWDFPDGTLAGREVAAYLVSAVTGWGVIPPTVLRDGPFGPGMCQLWVDVDPQIDLIDIVAPDAVPAGWKAVLRAVDAEDNPVLLVHADDVRLRRMAVLDAVINNGDRKGGHVLPLPDGTVHGVDHGVSFSVEDKLRTVLWGWAGEPLTEEDRAGVTAVVEALAGGLGERLTPLLTPEEIARTTERATELLVGGHHPGPAEGWPAIPWPPF